MVAHDVEMMIVPGWKFEESEEAMVLKVLPTEYPCIKSFHESR